VDYALRRKALAKVLEQQDVRNPTPAMIETPRKLLFDRAMRGYWADFPMNPAELFTDGLGYEYQRALSMWALVFVARQRLDELEHLAWRIGAEAQKSMVSMAELAWSAGRPDVATSARPAKGNTTTGNASDARCLSTHGCPRSWAPAVAPAGHRRSTANNATSSRFISTLLSIARKARIPGRARARAGEGGLVTG